MQIQWAIGEAAAAALVVPAVLVKSSFILYLFLSLFIYKLLRMKPCFILYLFLFSIFLSLYIFSFFIIS